MSKSYPERRMTADEARDRGINAVRGIVIALGISTVFWGVMLAAYVVGQR